MDRENYVSPFSRRYASAEMQYIFSEEKKFRTWRKLWIALARAEKNCGLPISDEQIAELEANRDNINYDDAEMREAACRHDVMSHIYAYGLLCPNAASIIHLGATSCYVADNTDIMLMKEGLELICSKLAAVISQLSEFALEYKSIPTLAYTHLQPAQLTTVGKRAALWINEFVLDLNELKSRKDTLLLLGCKGTTGTQASFLELFAGDLAKIDEMERQIAKEVGFSGCVPVSGQTYSRKTDYYVLSALSGFAQSASKFASDIRLLSSFKEIEEPFESSQIGSSAMPYKRNPMRCERISSLSRYLICDTLNPALTAASQWFERTLDDSANKRISAAEAFLAADSILNILLDVSLNLAVYPEVIKRRVMAELPFMATENILMHAVSLGGSRQELHERLRVHSQAAARLIKEEGKENDLIDRICADSDFGISKDEALKLLDPKLYTGRSAEQTERFINDTVMPILSDFEKSDTAKWARRRLEV